MGAIFTLFEKVTFRHHFLRTNVEFSPFFATSDEISRYAVELSSGESRNPIGGR